MGWFDAPGHEGVVLGDDVLDETYAFMRKLSRMYEGALGRKMTCEELQVLLDTSLRVNADDTLFSEFEEQKVASVQIKTAKRPKRQNYKAGDVFAIPLKDGRFAFGRVMEAGG
ncbi:MAG TPA: Imm26 family immunity protein, partial [Archangium sp.]|nr:Imm26 family immunity protein [Archangium sp.]